MDSALNPFNPGSGLRPPSLVGRQAEIDDFDLLVARSRAGRALRGMVVHGLRGVGKTVLLNRFEEQARSAGWMVARLEGSLSGHGPEGARRSLARQIGGAARQFGQRHSHLKTVVEALQAVRSFSLTVLGTGISLGVEPAPGRADSGQIDIDLEEMIEDLSIALQETSTTFGLFIDEMQDLDDDLLAALTTVQHLAGQREWPFVIVGAGLPILPTRLASIRSYAERLFLYRSIGPLNEAEARQALVDPVTRFGADFSEGSEELILTASGGYPFFLQAYGNTAWNVADGKHISRSAVTAAIIETDAELDEGFFLARWDKASPSERAYLRAMAPDGEGGSPTAMVAERAGVAPSALGPARASLIDRGIVYVPARGRVAFTVPGMSRYIERRITDEQ